MTLSELERRTQGAQFFRRISVGLPKFVPFDLERPISALNTRGVGAFLSHAPSQEWGPSASKIFVVPTYTYTYTFRPRESKLGMYSTHREGACFQNARQAPYLKGLN